MKPFAIVEGLGVVKDCETCLANGDEASVIHRIAQKRRHLFPVPAPESRNRRVLAVFLADKLQ